MGRQGNGPVFWVEDDVFIGASLGSDYCAEHEWGITDLKNDYEIPCLKPEDDSLIGIERRRTRLCSPKLEYIEFEDGAVLQHHHYGFVRDTEKPRPKLLEKYLTDEGVFWRAKDELVGSWDGDDFLLGAKKEHEDKLRQLFDAFKSKDIIMYLGGGGVFKNSGLVLAVASQIPEKLVTEWEDIDRDTGRLYRAFRATKIEDILAKAGRRYFALSPRWYTDDKTGEKKVHCWLNPMEQQDNNFGWYTIDELKDWADNSGPIPKKKKNKGA